VLEVVKSVGQAKEGRSCGRAVQVTACAPPSPGLLSPQPGRACRCTQMALLGTSQDASQQGGRGVPLPMGGVTLYRPEHTQGGRAAVHGCGRAALPKSNRGAAGVVPDQPGEQYRRTKLLPNPPRLTQRSAKKMGC